MFGASIGRAAQRIIDAIVRWLALGHINPNILTVIGVSLNVGCGLLFGYGRFFAAGIALIVANLFDMLDGQVARLSGRVTRFGGFLDSSLNRLSDMVVFCGPDGLLGAGHRNPLDTGRFFPWARLKGAGMETPPPSERNFDPKPCRFPPPETLFCSFGHKPHPVFNSCKQAR